MKQNNAFLVEENPWRNLVLILQLSKRQIYNSSPIVRVSIQNETSSAWSQEF